MICIRCGQHEARRYEAAYTPKRERFEAQSYYDRTVVTTLPPMWRCQCGAQFDQADIIRK